MKMAKQVHDRTELRRAGLAGKVQLVATLRV